MEKKKFLVTGCAGFIGTNLILRLMEKYESCQVFGIDNMVTGSEENIQLIMDKYSDRFCYIGQDISSRMNILDSIDINFDVIFNLACIPTPKKYMNNQIVTLDTCYLGMKNILEYQKRTKSKMVVQASTSEVYGDPLTKQQSESYYGNVNPVGPRSCYDEGKRVAETLCTAYKNEHGQDVRIIRIFNTYGPHMSRFDGRVLTEFITHTLKNEPITVYGGYQTRSMMYIDDLINGMLLLIECPKSKIDGPINFGNPEPITMNDLANEVLKCVGKVKGIKCVNPINTEKLPQDDPKQRCPDITKAKELLGWTPTIKLEEGLKKMVRYLDSRII